MLAPWKKSYDKPRQHIKKQRYHFANKGPSSQCYGFPSTHLQMRELDHKKRRSAEEWMLSNCDTGKDSCKSFVQQRSNQSILKEINPEQSLEGLMLKLKSFGQLMQKADSMEKTLMLGKIEGWKRREQQRIRWLDSIIHLTDMSLSKFQEIVRDREACHAAVHWVTKSWT